MSGPFFFRSRACPRLPWLGSELLVGRVASELQGAPVLPSMVVVLPGGTHPLASTQVEKGKGMLEVERCMSRVIVFKGMHSFNSFSHEKIIYNS